MFILCQYTVSFGFSTAERCELYIGCSMEVKGGVIQLTLVVLI